MKGATGIADAAERYVRAVRDAASRRRAQFLGRAVDIVTSVRDLRERLQREPDNVFVPTMGNLHAGHIQLMRLAKHRAACTVVSIFVNRIQFGPKEDFRALTRAPCMPMRK